MTKPFSLAFKQKMVERLTGNDGVSARQLALSLNNAGDEIMLLDNTGTERDRFAYTTSAESKRIMTTH